MFGFLKNKANVRRFVREVFLCVSEKTSSCLSLVSNPDFASRLKINSPLSAVCHFSITLLWLPPFFVVIPLIFFKVAIYIYITHFLHISPFRPLSSHLILSDPSPPLEHLSSDNFPTGNTHQELINCC